MVGLSYALTEERGAPDFVMGYHNNKILIIDDEKSICEGYSCLLNAYGFKCLTASNGKEGLELFRKVNPPFIITDTQMPVMNGLELIGQIRSRENPKTPCRIVSMSASTIHKGACIMAGADQFLPKPVQEYDLLNALFDKVLDPKPNILIVDDHVINRKILTRHLQRDYEIDTAENGKVALDKFKPGKYQLITMDHKMHEMNGVEATKAIRKIENKLSLNTDDRTPIIAVTASAMDFEQKQMIDAGVNEVVVAPYDAKELKRIIKSFL